MPDAAVVFDDSSRGTQTLCLRPAFNLKTGEKNLQSAYGPLTSLEIDLLTLASSVFACDIAFKRGERENITRYINLSVPVTNLAIFNNFSRQIHYVLYFLSHDAWKINFIQRSGTPEIAQNWPSVTEGKILLFSGGLDSFAAALNFGEAGEKGYLVSHVTANRVVSGAQEILFAYLSNKFPNQFSRLPIQVGGRSNPNRGFLFPSDNEREDSQRTRSFLFLVLAGIYARRLGIKDVLVIAENGQLAIHLPLTAARISAFSTHTAHPEFIHCMNEILSQILSYQLNITNPFLYKTKAEVVKNAVQNHADIVQETVSCWRASRMGRHENHCGVCIPCLTRRISIEANGMQLREYRRDIFSQNLASLDVEDEGKRNLVELAEFVKTFENAENNAIIEDLYPDLSNKYIDVSRAIDMYRRFAGEARSVFIQYPSLKKVVE